MGTPNQKKWTPEQEAVLMRYMDIYSKEGKSAGWRYAAVALNRTYNQCMGHYYDMLNRQLKSKRQPKHQPEKQRRKFKNITDTKPPVVHKERVSGLSDDMKLLIVLGANARVEQLQKLMEDIRPAYEEKKIAFDMAKEEFDGIANQWNGYIEEQTKQEAIISEFVATSPKEKFNPPPVKAKFVTGQENAFVDKPIKHQKKYIKWLVEASEVLKENNKFMTPKAIYEAIIVKPHIKEVLKEMRTAQVNPGGVRFGAIRTWLEHAKMYVEDTSKSAVYKPFLTIHENLLGRYDWVDQHNVPKPEYIKEFMYGRHELEIS